jgi:hypothetical protein
MKKLLIMITAMAFGAAAIPAQAVSLASFTGASATGGVKFEAKAKKGKAKAPKKGKAAAK